jgi:uncharacterized membrane protein YkoI
MPRSMRKLAAAVAGLAALALGGAVIANAADTASTSGQASGSQTQQQHSGPPTGGPPPGRHVGANGQREKALDPAVAAKVKAAALDKVPGATVERVETDVDHGSPYEAHVRKADGTELEVLVNESFAVTATNTMRHP